MESVCTCRRPERTSSKSDLEMNVDVKRFEISPKVSVTANPRIGPVPNWNRNAAAMKPGDVRVDERQEHAAEARVDGGLHALARLELFLDALEDEHVRVDADADREDEAGDAGQRHDRADIGHHAEQDDQVQHERDDGVHAGQLVVDEQERHDEQQAGERRQHAGANRVGAERRADGLLLQIRQRRRQRARSQDEREVLRFLLRKAAGNLAVARNPPVDARRRLHRLVEHDREEAPDVLARHARERRPRPRNSA